MSARDTLKLINTTNLISAGLKYCLVSTDKLPFKINGKILQPNNINDFVSLKELEDCKILDDFAGIGISIQGSNICAIDVDHCFSVPFDQKSADRRALDVIEKFKNIAYIEFSFSGTGLRLLFKHPLIECYSRLFYIKNSKNQIEYYEPSKSYRYVTLTGRSIINNNIHECPDSILYNFLNTYMLKPIKDDRSEILSPKIETRSFEEIFENVKYHYLTNHVFQDRWFGKAPGAGKDESERDYYIINYIYTNITQDKKMIKQIFESSPYFKSKDHQHVYKWNYNDNRYLNFIYDQIRR